MNAAAGDGDEPVEIQSWEGYVDEIGDGVVKVMLADLTHDQGDAREIGTFPSHLMSHLDLSEGMFLTVRVMSDESILIEPIVRTDADRQAGEAKVEELLDLVRRLRDDVAREERDA